VPHSGTRFVNDAFKKQGIEIVQKHNRALTCEPEMVFCHIGPRWVEFLEEHIEHSTKVWMTVRSPIGTWGTQWKGAHKSFDESGFTWKRKLGQLRGQWETQMQIASQFPHIHRVDLDPMSKLGDYVGLTLSEDNQTFSTFTPMKTAIADRDTKTIAKLCEGTDFWECFVEYITPDIADFYEDLGYDIWWKNG